MKKKYVIEIQLPDILFCKFCEDQFGINRGIYNTIDSWFFHQGIEQILERRIITLDFLRFVRSRTDQPLKKAKFGHGGLTIKLNEYWQMIRPQKLEKLS